MYCCGTNLSGTDKSFPFYCLQNNTFSCFSKQCFLNKELIFKRFFGRLFFCCFLGWKTATLPINTSIHSTKMNGDNGNKNNNHEHGREHTRNKVNRNLSQENGEERSETSRKPVTMKGKSASVGIPFVRAHSTGFISLADDDESTEGSSSSSSPSSSSVGTMVGGNSMMMTPQIVGMFGIGGEDSSAKLLKFGPCLCWNTTSDGQNREVECKCTGEAMTNIVRDLPTDIDRL